MLIDFFIANPESSHAHFGESAITGAIVFNRKEMRPAIDLYSQLCRCTIEIDDVSGDHLLASEVEAIQRVPSESAPERFLLRGHLPAQRSRELKFLTSHELFASYFHLSPSPSPFRRGEQKCRRESLRPVPIV